MKHKKIKLGVLLLGVGITTQAQQSVNPSGGDASGIGGSVAYSIGQVFYTVNESGSGTVSQGVQQPYEIFKIGINQSEIDVLLTVFPNPTATNLTLQVGNYNNEKLLYQLYDTHGKLLISEQVAANETQISTESLPPAAYFIHVVNQQSKKIQSFKIIKN